jgi:hypothetical protein
MSYKDLKKKQAQEAAGATATAANGNGLAKGQGTLDGHMGGKEAQAGNGAADESAMDVDGEDEEGDTTISKASVRAADTNMED